MRAVFPVGKPVRKRQTHIVWEFIGTHDEYMRTYWPPPLARVVLARAERASWSDA
jgi:phage-related protein